MAAASPAFNFNVGVLGHVDSGKTSLSKALSTVASTACFDKNPQSKERGITLDLGFSSFLVDIPEHLGDIGGHVQFTFVDCPGHASLIRTIIGGAQIIDLMILVVDITKGIQTQTAECLVIGEITCKKMIVVLNKTDLLPDNKRNVMIDKMKKRLLKTLENTKFAGCSIVAVAAKPGGTEAADGKAQGLAELIETLKKNVYVPKRDLSGPFIFSVDHCFSIHGQGTVMTGTAICGSISINDTIEIPLLKMTKKVKSMQMFKNPVEKVKQGDRAGICVTQFDPKLLERGLICSPKALPTIVAGIISVHEVGYFKGHIATKAKFHISMGHETVMGQVTFFSLCGASNNHTAATAFDFSKEYMYEELLVGEDKDAENKTPPTSIKHFALLQLEKPITCSHSCLVIGSKLDTDIHANLCRIAFHGQLLEAITDPAYPKSVLPLLKIYKIKSKEGQIERVTDSYTVICKNMFKKESNLEAFCNLRVALSTGEEGFIEGGFGQSGKVKVRIPGGLNPRNVERYSGTKKKTKEKLAKETTAPGNGHHEPVKLFLTFKKYVFDPTKKIIQN